MQIVRRDYMKLFGKKPKATKEEKRAYTMKLQQFILCFALYLLISPQSHSLYMEDSSQNYFDVLYNNFSGLPTSEANDVVQTKDGYIWIGSYSSLIRYDGKEFVSYAHTQGLTSVLCLFIDAQDRLWIGTNNDGVVLYENNSFTFVNENQDVPSYSVRSITQTTDGSILVGTAMGLYTIMEQGEAFEITVLDDPRLKDSFVYDLESFGENQAMGITKSGDIFFLEDGEIAQFIAMENWQYDIPLSVLPREDHMGSCFWIGTNSNYIVKMRPTTKNGETSFTYQKILTGSLKYLNDLMEDSNGRTWIGADTGVGYMDSTGNIITLDYLSVSESVEHIMEDMEGNFWITSSKEGLLKLNTSVFKNLTSNLKEVTQVNGVEILDGLIYVVSSNGIDIIRESNQQSVTNSLTQTYRGEYFRCVQKDEQGFLWFSSYSEDGLIKYNPKTEETTIFNQSTGLDYSRIRSTMIGSDGKVWVATGNGVYVIENDKVVDYFGSEQGIQNLEILTISQDLEGRVFVGTDGAGLYIIEDNVVTTQVSRDSGLHSDIILRTESDPFNGGTWIITGNSIAFYNPDTKEVRNIDKFPYGNNFDLLFFEDNMIILSSNGIYFVTHASMMSQGEEELLYLHKNQLNGLFSSAVANSFSKVENGTLYFCGYQNLTAFDMKVQTEEGTYIPPIDVPTITVNDGKLYPTGENTYHLPSTANFLQFDILIPTYALQDYSVGYQILGYDEFMHYSSYIDYKDPTYTNLPGGEYEFLIQLTDNRFGGVINETQFTIVKEYSFTESPTTKAFSFYGTIIALTLLFRYIIKLREKKSREKQEDLTLMFRDTVEVLAKVIDAKDRYTNGHSKRVAYYTRAIATAMSFSQEEIESAYGVALLHDVGKITIPDDVLNKPGRLDEEEFEVMKGHASNGANILEGIHAWPDLVVGAKYHHERYDGTGYGNGLKGNEIPQIARIICVADAFDAMHSSRVYRKQMDLDYVLSELELNSGTQFDPVIVSVFVNLVRTGVMDKMLEAFAEEDKKINK